MKEENKKNKKKDADIDKEVEIREVIVEKKVGFNYAEVIVIMLITLIIGGMVGSFISFFGKDNKTTNILNNSEISSELNEFLEVYNTISSEYYKDKDTKIDNKELIKAGINGMFEYLGDNHSIYMTEEDTKAFNETVDGEYKGIGVEIVSVDGHTVINRVFTDSPADEAGLQVEDIFVSVDGEDVYDKDPSSISALIKDSDKESVKVVVKRNGEDKEFELDVRKVIIDTVVNEVYENNGKKIGYIYISVFTPNTTKQFKSKLKELEDKKIDSLIIDVRSNNGGYLSTVTDMVSIFMNKSKIIYQLDTNGIIEQVYSNTDESRSYPIAVLINKASASASEILAAALQESYGAKVIGTNSYGKGTVQKAKQLESGATIKYTVQRWLTPKGTWIDGVGVTPDIEVELTKEYFTNPSDETDNQLQAAIKEVSK